jgi:hypothetical protein
MLTDTSPSQTFNLPSTLITPPHLLSAQIQLNAGVWTDIRTLDGFTRIDNNAKQINIIRTTANTYADYQVRFLLKK